MVLIGGVKYACERCIRGHRVTTCNHTDQPLIMIKPKGRPSSQCKHCKNLRVNKNSHSSGACTCGKSTSDGNIKKKKCGCEIGKSCDCHKKRVNQSKSPTSLSSPTTTNQTSTPLSSLSSVSDVQNRRAGEVSVSLNEYVPNNPRQEIGNVLNDKSVAGFFRDVPLPFEPGRGLLDLFDNSDTSQSKPSSNESAVSSPHNHSISSQSQYSNNGFYNSSSHDSQYSLKRAESYDTGRLSSNRNSIDKKNYRTDNYQGLPFDKKDFDIFQNLGLIGTNTPSAHTRIDYRRNASLHSHDSYEQDNASVHSTRSVETFNTKPNNIRDTLHHSHTDTSLTDKKSHRQSSSLFGNYSSYPSEPRIAEDGRSDSKVEVLSLTPSFNDIIPEYDIYEKELVNNEKRTNNIGSELGLVGGPNENNIN